MGLLMFVELVEAGNEPKPAVVAAPQIIDGLEEPTFGHKLIATDFNWGHILLLSSLLRLSDADHHPTGA